MDRVELRKFLGEEQAAARRWREEAEKALKETEVAFGDFHEYVLSVGKSNLSEEDKGVYRELKELLSDARKDVEFFKGVEEGINTITTRLRERLAREELINAGRWVPKIIKPRRR